MNHTKFLLTIFILTGIVIWSGVLLAQTMNIKVSPTVVSPDVVCTKEYAPVCGVDNKTYSNACMAEKVAKVAIKHKGECQTSVLPKPLPTPVSPSPSAVRITETVCTQEAKLCPDGSYVSRTGPNCEFSSCPSVSTPKPSSAVISSKCRVNSFSVSNECGVGAFKEAYVQCHDGYEEELGGENSCQSSEVWQKYATEICANRCAATEAPKATPGFPPALKPLPPPEVKTTPSLPPTPKPVFSPLPSYLGVVQEGKLSVCYIPEELTQNYNNLILDLRKAEKVGDSETAEAIKKKITALKQGVERAQEECALNVTRAAKPQEQKPFLGRIETSTEHIPLYPSLQAVDRCQEVSQWENKIAHYQRLVGLNDTELKTQIDFSREEIKQILDELSQSLVKVKAQCDEQRTIAEKNIRKNISVIARDREGQEARRNIVEPVKPVVTDSGQEINAYYKAKIGIITAEENTDVQIEKLKLLKAEIEDLIAKLIKSRKEIEVSELSNTVSEIKVGQGEIKADEVVVKTTDKKIFFNVGGEPVSIVPTEKQVIIQDKNFEVIADEVLIKDNTLRVGNSEVKLMASEVAAKLNVSPIAAELKEENNRAVYKFKVVEQRKLFGFIPMKVTKTLTVDAVSGDLLRERLPWYFFLTIK